MSLQEQERAMFDLMFDHELRERFLQKPQQALSTYELDEQEKADFLVIRPDALQVDAKMRVFMIMGQLCQELPLTCAIASAFEGGIDKLKSMVDVQLMSTHVRERAAVFATAVRDWLAEQRVESEHLHAMILAVVGAEIAMAWSSASLKKAILAGEKLDTKAPPVPGNWAQQPASLVPFVCAVIVPQSYALLRQQLTPGDSEALWSCLTQSPVDMQQLILVLQNEDPRLMVSRAITGDLEHCDPTISQQTIELSDGFASFIQHMNGQYSVEFILQQLKLAGAEDDMLTGVKSGFYELFKAGMLRQINAG